MYIVEHLVAEETDILLGLGGDQKKAKKESKILDVYSSGGKKHDPKLMLTLLHVCWSCKLKWYVNVVSKLAVLPQSGQKKKLKASPHRSHIFGKFLSSIKADISPGHNQKQNNLV